MIALKYVKFWSAVPSLLRTKRSLLRRIRLLLLPLLVGAVLIVPNRDAGRAQSIVADVSSPVIETNYSRTNHISTTQHKDLERKALPQSSFQTQSTALDSFGELPLSFEANTGQAQQPVKFLSRGSGYTLFLTGTEAVVALYEQPSKGNRGRSPNFSQPRGQGAGATLRMKFVGANPEPHIAGEGELRGEVNYLIGERPENWQTGVSTYSKVRYENIYPGIDVVYYGNQRELEYDFVVAPGANPSLLRLSFEGARGMRVDANGDLVMRVGAGEIR